MKKQLVIDLGNSRIKLGVFANGLLQDHLIFSDLDDSFSTYITKGAWEKIMVSSTGDWELVEKIQAWVGQIPFFVLEISQVKGIQWAYQNLGSLGKDRIASLKGAQEKWPQKWLCVADAGTCLTLDFLGPDGKHWGGIISPGLQMRFAAMSKFTARLPIAHVSNWQGLLGNSTESCLAAGAVSGMVGEIEFQLKQFKIRHSAETLLVLAGGDADYLAHHLISANFVAPFLVLEGLHSVLSNLG